MSQPNQYQGWSEEETELLSRMWQQGYSARDIQRHLPHRTRSMICGKIDRLGFPPRPMRANARLQEGPRLHRAAAKPLPKKEPPVATAAALTEAGEWAATLESVEDGMCRWPIGDVGDADFHYCGNAQHGKSSYCEGHTHKAHQPGSVREKAVKSKSPQRLSFGAAQ